VKTIEATRQPRYEGDDSLHGSARYAPDDFLILVDGLVVGGTYWCSYNPAVAVPGWGWDDGGIAGESWASWGPRGLSCGHPTREAAEQAQVREYATNPDLYDRRIAMEEAGREAAAARQQAQRDAEYERCEAARRRERLGDDEPGPVIWTLPAFHALYADMTEVNAVSAWIRANGLEHVSGRHEVRVEQRATRRVAVFEKPTAVWNGRSTESTETHVVTIVTDPPAVTTPARPDLHGLFAEHWPSWFPLIDFGQSVACGKCTQEVHATVSEKMVTWPCPTVEQAIGTPRPALHDCGAE
jgi:hypothetical protein